MSDGGEGRIGDVPLAELGGQSYDEILAAGRVPREADDDPPFSFGALVGVLAIFGALVTGAVLMVFADRNEVTVHSVMPGATHATVAVSHAPPGFGPVANAPAPVVEHGSGVRVFDVHPPDDGLTLVVVKVNGGRFTLSSVDQHDVRKTNVAVGIGPYAGTTITRGDSLRRLRMESTGTWVVELHSASVAPVRQAPFSGTGPDVFWYTGPAAIGDVTSERQRPGAWLRIAAYGKDLVRSPVALLTREGAERVHWPAGPVLVHVEAGAPWRVGLSPI